MKITIKGWLLFLLSGVTTAGWCGDANWQFGVVRVFGSIVPTTCTISTGNQSQIVRLPDAGISRLLLKQETGRKKFTIHFTQCSLSGPTASNFKITFDSNDTSDELFMVSGGVGDVGLRISDSSGSTIRPGVPAVVKPKTLNDTTAEYEVSLERYSGNLAVGSYAAAVRYQLDYY